VVSGWAEDSDRLRLYLGLRGQDTNPLTDVHDAWGVSLGLNLNRYFGVEFAADTYELEVTPGSHPNLGEYSVWPMVLQARLRYPFLAGRLVPYLLAGGGVAFTQFQDRKGSAYGLSVKDQASTPVGSVGGGLDYFVADNIALDLEVRYLFGEEQTLRVDGTAYAMSVNAPLLMLGLRLFYPELRPAPLAEAADHVPTRVYLGVHAGGAIPVHHEAFPDVFLEPEPPAFCGMFDQLFGFRLGLNFGRCLGVELVGEGYETTLEFQGVGSLGEYAVWDVIPHLRLRYPVADGRVVPYALAGVGLGY
jgi:opacity protein-like surface antigen